MGAQYGSGGKSLSKAVSFILHLLYATESPAHFVTAPQQEHNQRRHEQNAQRDDLIRKARANGATYPEIVRTFGVSLGRAHQIVNHKL